MGLVGGSEVEGLVFGSTVLPACFRSLFFSGTDLVVLSVSVCVAIGVRFKVGTGVFFGMLISKSEPNSENGILDKNFEVLALK